MSRRRSVTGRLLCGLVVWTAVAQSMQAGSPVPFVTVARGVHSGVKERLDATVRTTEAWAVLWARHSGASVAPPPVDFSAEMIVAVFAGGRSTSGYEVEITEVVAIDGELRVTYRERRPPGGAIVLPALTSPFHIIRLPRAEGPVHVGEAPG